MLIDTSSILASNPLNTLAKSSAPQPTVSGLMAELNLVVGQKVLATVQSINAVSTEERGLLSKFISDERTQGKTEGRTSELLASVSLKHVQLKLNQQLINALTTQTLSKGQAVSLIVKPDGLQIIPPKPTGLGITEVALTPKTHQSLAPVKPLSEIMEPLKRALTQALPISEKHSVLFKAIDSLVQNIQNEPPNKVTPQLSQLTKALESLSRHYSLDIPKHTTPDAKATKHAILASGAFYEHKALSKIEADQSSLLQKSSAAKPSLNTNTAPAAAPSPQPPSDQDLKGALVQLSQWLQSAPPPSPSKTEGADNIIAKLWLNLLQASQHRHPNKADAPDLGKLLLGIQQLVQRSIARVQVQQYRTLISAHQDSATNTVNIDIPVRTPEGYSTIVMQIFEPRLKQDEKDKKKQNKLIRKAKWRVFMEIELEQDGALAIELSVCGKKMDATFWAESAEVRGRAEDSIQQLKQDLESKGLDVTDLRCSKNPPPQQKVQMNLSLIDIRT